MADNNLDNTPALVPHLVVNDAAAAIDFYIRAFDATEMMRLPSPDGRILHACIQIHGHPVFLNDDFPEYCDGTSTTPTALGGTPVTIHLHGPDVDARFKQAVEAGATAVAEPEDQFWGDRYATVRDPFGHQWSLAESVREVDYDTMVKEMSAQK